MRLHLTCCVALLLVSGTSGCSWWPSNQLQQCRDESNRALGRYQLESQRAERLEVQNRQQSERIAELEKRLALMHDGQLPAESLATTETKPPTEGVAPLAPNQPPPKLVEPPQSAWRAAPKRSF